MSCPTCDHTMENIGSNDRADNYFHCSRCGTVKIDAFGQHGDKVYVPKLVERCRTFGTLLPGVSLAPDRVAGEWHRLGIAESINVPPRSNP